jgi:hypothetical protein
VDPVPLMIKLAGFGSTVAASAWEISDRMSCGLNWENKGWPSFGMSPNRAIVRVFMRRAISQRDHLVGIPRTEWRAKAPRIVLER